MELCPSGGAIFMLDRPCGVRLSDMQLCGYADNLVCSYAAIWL